MTDYQVTQLMNLLFALAMTPVIAGVSSRMRVSAGREWFIAAYLFAVAAFFFGVAEGIALRSLFHLLQHAAYVGCGWLFAKAAWETRKAVVQAPEPRP